MQRIKLSIVDETGSESGGHQLDLLLDSATNTTLVADLDLAINCVDFFGRAAELVELICDSNYGARDPDQLHRTATGHHRPFKPLADALFKRLLPPPPHPIGLFSAAFDKVLKRLGSAYPNGSPGSESINSLVSTTNLKTSNYDYFFNGYKIADAVFADTTNTVFGSGAGREISIIAVKKQKLVGVEDIVTMLQGMSTGSPSPSPGPASPP